MGAPTLSSLLAQLRGVVDDDRVLAALAAVPRERFVPDELRAHAFENVALPIARGQTISQPAVIARMLALARVCPGQRVLDVGTGTGYHAALLAALGARVWSVERDAALSETAAATLAALGVATVTCVVGDGARGLPAEAPFDAINVAASARAIPRALLEQLTLGGRLVVPVGEREQYLELVVRNAASEWRRERHEPVRFVPLVEGP